MRKLVYVLMALILISCDPMVIFTEPQPQGKEDLSNFPGKYLGMYRQSNDSSIYLVTEKEILEKYEEYIADSRDDILAEEDIELIGDTVLLMEDELSFPVTCRNDSVFGWIVLYDTIFSINRGDRLRKLGKHYFINMPGDSLWVVVKLQFNKNGSVYKADIDHEAEMDIFRQHCDVEVVTDDEGNPSRYILDPTSKELKKLLKLDTFTDTTGYVRISQELPR